MNRGSINLVDMGATYRLGIVLSRPSYHHRWSMGATFIVDDPDLAPVLSDTRLLSSEALGDREIC